MFLSKLVVNVGDRADRRRPGRHWIQQPYRVHQRLCMAFPNHAAPRDRALSQPFDPADFFDYPGTSPKWDATVKGLPKDVHVPRDGQHGFLFRIDADQDGRPFVLVQSAREPNWDYAFHNAELLLNGRPQMKPLDLGRVLESKQRFRFRLVANPTEKTKRLTQQEQEAGRPPRDKPRRLACFGHSAHVTWDAAQVAWLERKASTGGFTVVKDEELLAVPAGIVHAYRNRDCTISPMTMYAVRFDGLLTVTDPTLFRQTLAAGIGPAKAFGFGLLSIAPATNPPLTPSASLSASDGEKRGQAPASCRSQSPLSATESSP